MALEAKASGLLIDVLEFPHKPTEDVMAYRKEHVIPLYNQAGIRRMAFQFAGNTPGTANHETVIHAEWSHPRVERPKTPQGPLHRREGARGGRDQWR